MSDLIPMPADGDGINKGAPDGVSGTPTGPDGIVHGRSPQGESGGGSYPNPFSDDDKEAPSSHGLGGQTEMTYHGGPNPNSGVGTSAGNEQDRAPAPTAKREAHEMGAAGHTIKVVETSGIAAAEATGKLGSHESDDPEETAGSG